MQDGIRNYIEMLSRKGKWNRSRYEKSSWASENINLNLGNLAPFFRTVLGHSWFATVVDGNELGPVYPFQLKQLEYEDP